MKKWLKNFIETILLMGWLVFLGPAIFFTSIWLAISTNNDVLKVIFGIIALITVAGWMYFFRWIGYEERKQKNTIYVKHHH